MDDETRIELIRKFGPATINMFVHLECVNSFAGVLPSRTEIILGIQYFKPKDLIGRWKDIVSCDACKKAFSDTDSGYLRITLIALDELCPWITVLEERIPNKP